MIGVFLTEETRTFVVRVGRKVVGKLSLFSNGRAFPYIVEKTMGDGYRSAPGGGVYRTRKQATDQILRHEGFGKSEGIVVKRNSGGIAG